GHPQPAHGRVRPGADTHEPALCRDRRRPRHRGRRAAGHRPGDDGGAAVAHHLQRRAQRGADHVRRHLLRRHVRRLDHLHPAEHAGGVVLGDHRHRGKQDGQERPRRPGTGHGRDRLVHRRHDRDRPAGGARPVGRRSGRPARRAVLLRDHAARAGCGHRRPRQLEAARLHRAVPRACHRAGRSQHRTVPADVRQPPAGRRDRHRRGRRRNLRHRRGAVGRGPPAPATAGDHPRRAALDGQGRLAPLLATVAARHRVRVPVRRRPGRWCRAADVPLVRDRAEAVQEARGVRARRHRRRGRSGGREQRLRRRDAGSAAGAGDSHHGHGRCDPGGHHQLRHRAGTGAVRHRAAAGVDPARQPVHRQCVAAGAEPATGAAVGEAPADPEALPVRRHPVLRLAGRMDRELPVARPAAPAAVRSSGSGDAPLRAPRAAAGDRGHPRAASRVPAVAGAGPVGRQGVNALERAGGSDRVRGDRPDHSRRPAEPRPGTGAAGGIRRGRADGRERWTVM
ncbi:MAG: Tripartite tricarboxylate transporter TctA family, partial [uncultured Nocardioidaceae bacterium]